MIKKIAMLGLMLVCFSHAFSQKTPEDILNRFFEIYSQKNSNDALDYLFSNNGYADEMTDEIEGLKKKLKKQIDAIGLYYGRDSLSMRSAGPNFLKYSYLVRHARQPMLFHFTFYKADNRWQAHIFSYQNNAADELDEASKISRLKENFN